MPFQLSTLPKTTLWRINALRALAAIAVLLYHSQTYLWQNHLNSLPVFSGLWGVDLFFIISGFVIHISHARLWGQKHAAIQFGIKRFFRLIPLYWLLTSIIVSGLLICPHFFNSYQFSWIQLVQSLCLWPGEYGSFLAVAWTLSFELFFYTCFGIALLLFRSRSAILGIIPIFIVFSLLWDFFPAETGYKFFASYSLLLEFCMGLISAELCLRYIQIPPIVLALLGLLGAYLGFPIAVDNSDYRVLGYGLTLWPWFQLLAQWDMGLQSSHRYISLHWLQSISVKLANSSWIKSLGEGSYSLYLVHMFVLKAVISLFNHFHVNTNFNLTKNILCLSIAIVLGLLSGQLLWILIDRPSQRLFKKWITKLPFLD